LQGRPPTHRMHVAWPGPGSPTVQWLRELRSAWLTLLDGLTAADFDAPAHFPWHDDPHKTVAHTVAWVNAELMKNAAEVGQLRILRNA
jgi:hypothetical protein